MKKLFLISILINCVFLFFIAKRIYFTTTYKVEKSVDPYVVFTKSRLTLFKQLPIDTNDVVFIGDSHIQLMELAELFPSRHVKNRGLIGDFTTSVLKRLDEVTVGKPKKIFIEVGINDIFSNVPIDTIIRNYEKIVSRIALSSPKTQIYTISIFPTTAKFTDQNKTIIQFNTHLKELSEKYHCQYIDAYTSLSSNSSLNNQYASIDGVHLNGLGDMVLQKLLIKFV